VDDDIQADADVEREYGFTPAVPATASEDARHGSRTHASATFRRPGKVARRGKRSHRSLSRRLSAAGVLVAALISLGAAYAALASASSASASPAADIAAGQQIYQTTCISCHGANLQGVQGRGPSLIAVGGASVYFQVSTGRMPATGQGATEGRKQSRFTEQQVEQLAAYVESIGGGPAVPTGNLRDADIAAGGDLFRTNCASCHGTTFKGAPLSAGKAAPGLGGSTDAQIYTAMLTGPESMPIFSNNQLTPTQKKQIIAYVQTLKASKDPGGSGIDRIGPVSEAIVIWVGGVGAVMIAILWIGAKSQ
jgi:ubiquinol-cytochrome c reductase cytochrome c subunit